MSTFTTPLPKLIKGAKSRRELCLLMICDLETRVISESGSSLNFTKKSLSEYISEVKKINDWLLDNETTLKPRDDA